MKQVIKVSASEQGDVAVDIRVTIITESYLTREESKRKKAELENRVFQMLRDYGYNAYNIEFN